MSFSLLHKLVAYLISGLGLGALALGSELSTLSIALIVLGYAASFFAEGKLLELPHYAQSWTAAVVLFLLLQLTRGLTDELTLAMAMEFAAFLQISRLFNRRTAADYQQIAVLAFLHLIAATVLSVSLLYAVLFIGFVIVTPWMLALSNLRREIESNYSSTAEPDDKALAAIRRVLASRRVVGPRFLVGTAALAVPIFIMTLFIFVLVPRVGKGFFGFQRERAQRVAGFGNLIELGGFGLIRDDPTVVLRVTPLPATQRRPPRMNLRLRGTSFDSYDGRRWTRTPISGNASRPGRRFYPVTRWSDFRGASSMKIVLNRLEEKVVFLPGNTVALELPERLEGGRRVTPQLVRSRGLDIRYIDDGSMAFVYTAYVNKRATAVDYPYLDPGDKRLYLKVPPDHERIAALAREVTRGATSPLEKIERILKHLRDSGRYRYSLLQPLVGDRPPLEAFLFDQKRGHCEYFSSAMAVMLRAVGIPSRNVSGFLGGTYNRYGDYYALSQSDAHSWVEGYVAGYGWVPLDPTPPAGQRPEEQIDLWSTMRAMLDAVRTRWMTSVVAYNLQTQIGMAYKVFRVVQAVRGSDFVSEIRKSGGKLGKLSRKTRRVLLWSIFGAALLGVALWLFLRWRGARSGGDRPLSRNASEAVKLYRELERTVERAGHPRPPSSTPCEHAFLLERKGVPWADQVGEVTRCYMEARYGDRSLPPAEIARLRSLIASIGSAGAASRAARQ